MARYIDAELLIKNIAKIEDLRTLSTKTIGEAISNTPTADVVEVVMCSECKYQDDCARQMVHTTRDYVLEQNISTYNKVDFCSYGERRDT